MSSQVERTPLMFVSYFQMKPPLNPSMVLSILHEHSPHYAAMYLEVALEIGVALPQDYHSELLLIYLQDILHPVSCYVKPMSTLA